MRQVPQPILIGGCDRSGTTLLARLLGEATGFVVLPESGYFVEAIRASHGKDRLASTQAVIDAMLRHYKFSHLGIGTDLARRRLSHYDNLGHLFSELVSLYASTAGVTQPKGWIDHTPSNVRRAFEWQNVFPNARFVHIVRDPRGVASSLMRVEWGPRFAWEAADWWRDRVAAGLAAEALYPSQVYRLQFEELVADVETTMQKLVAWLRVERTDAESMPFVLPDYTRHQHQLVTLAPDASRIDGWRHSLKPQELQDIEWRAGSLMQSLGYQLSVSSWTPPLKSRWRSLAERLISLLAETLVAPIQSRSRRKP